MSDVNRAGDGRWACRCGCDGRLPISARLAAEISTDDRDLSTVALEHAVPIWVARHVRLSAERAATQRPERFDRGAPREATAVRPHDPGEASR
jgi:hypothetical protein